MIQESQTKAEGVAHDDLYREDLQLCAGETLDEFVADYQISQASPFHLGGTTKGYVRGLAIRKLLADLRDSGRRAGATTLLDAGCGQGHLSLYLASQGYSVVSVDLSEIAIGNLERLAARYGLSDRVRGLATSLERLPVESGSIDAVIGHASLHHFIKYVDVARELHRVLRPRGRGYFADSFGENKLYSLFHDKELMARLGDVSLTRDKISQFFIGFDVTLFPTDWFCMLDKLFLKLLPQPMLPVVRMMSRVHFSLDRAVPARNSLALLLSGAVMTQVTRLDTPTSGRCSIDRFSG